MSDVEKAISRSSGEGDDLLMEPLIHLEKELDYTMGLRPVCVCVYLWEKEILFRS